MDLCEECARKYGIGEPPSFSLSELLSKTGLFDEEPSTELTCPHCGFSPSDAHFKKMGLLGCPHCYEQFRDMLGTILKDLHQDAHHAGKVPHAGASSKPARKAPSKATATAAAPKATSKSTPKVAEQSPSEKLAELAQQMQDAIAAEAYEKAAVIRDQIAALKAQKPSA